MNRRTLLLLSTMLGGLAPLRLLAQEPGGTRQLPRAPSRRNSGDTPKVARGRSRDDPDPARDEPDPPAADREEHPPNLPTEPGHQWKSFNIAAYTGLDHKDNNPQGKIVEWIQRRTTTAPWHGEKIAVLAAGRSKLLVYNNAKILDQVAEVVQRFTEAENNYLSIRIRFVNAANPRWRANVSRRLNLIGSGPQGQQVWFLDGRDAEGVLTQMQVYQGFVLLADKTFELINGQTLKFGLTKTRTFPGGLQREAAANPGFQPKTEELEEGVTLKLSPLLSYEGDRLDAGLELTTNNVRTFHPVRVLAPREAGPGELKIDVPEVSETNLNQTIKDLRLGQTLLISAGIQPGILASKDGLFNMRIPGTVPTSTEFLAFIDIELADAGPAAARDRPRPRR